MCLATDKSEYGNLARKLREQNRSLMSSIYTLNSQVQQSIRDFNNAEIIDILFENMAEYPVGEEVEINDKVSTKAILVTDNKLVFKTVFKKGGELATHIHSNCKETIKIVRGWLLEATTGEEYTDGHTIKYKPNERHNPIALDQTLLLVTLEKNE